MSPLNIGPLAAINNLKPNTKISIVICIIFFCHNGSQTQDLAQSTLPGALPLKPYPKPLSALVTFMIGSHFIPRAILDLSPPVCASQHSWDDGGPHQHF
jgi:hypothetical protein